MNKGFKKAVECLLLLACLFISMPIMAQQTKPLWIQKGEKPLNKERTNETYHFKVFNTYDVDANRLKTERFRPLLTYVRERYGANFKQMELDSVLYVGNDTLTTYRIEFTDTLGMAGVVHARKVDEYLAFEDYVDNTYQFEYYQLYAISERDSVPVFDEFELTRTYNHKALFLSLIPGMGQIYKGQKAKGYTILGTEATLVVSTIAFQMKKHYCGRKANEQWEVRDSWKSKERGWRQMRNLCIGLAGGLYLYNLIDAAVTKGSRHVVIKKPKERHLYITPAALPDGAAMTLTFNF
ncbi:DUF5683 domain-containing protein [uncultured Parabacteroides sp.]|uniref:DUF5683 domain-containing protein n=1 Tax=uncultured Parabacteroides sp. TaxID=512312 RepID=UPI002639ABA4|nr:DUF5683 domain-containing protein [uncultured Parabacteroides sp.]